MATLNLPTPLAVVPKPGARFSFFLQGPGGRNVALLWGVGEAEQMALAVNFHDRLVAAVRTAVNRIDAPHFNTKRKYAIRDDLNALLRELDGGAAVFDLMHEWGVLLNGKVVDNVTAPTEAEALRLAHGSYGAQARVFNLSE